jgi:hypothetical protein
MTANGTAKRFKIKKVVKHAIREYITTVDAEDAHLLRSYQWTVISNDGGYDYVMRHGPRVLSADSTGRTSRTPFPLPHET